MAGFSITVQKPPFVLIPHNSWSVAYTVKAVRTFNKPVQAAKKFGEDYCLDTSFMLVERDSKSLTYVPRKIFRFALWGMSRRTKLGKIGDIGIACAVGSYEIYRLVYPTNTKINAFLRGATFTVIKLSSNFRLQNKNFKI